MKRRKREARRAGLPLEEAAEPRGVDLNALAIGLIEEEEEERSDENADASESGESADAPDRSET